MVVTGDCTAQGYVFPTALPDQAHVILSRDIAPVGYAYLLIWGGWATLAACSLEPRLTRPGSRERAAAAFARAVPGLDLGCARPFSGRGHLLGQTRPVDRSGRLYVGEAAGLQDPAWGFGLRYALESGALAARCLLDDTDYESEVLCHLEPVRRAAALNRQIFRLVSGRAAGSILGLVASSTDTRETFGRYCSPAGVVRPRLGGVMASVARRRRHDPRDLSCGGSSCRCMPCRCLSKKNSLNGHHVRCRAG